MGEADGGREGEKGGRLPPVRGGDLTQRYIAYEIPDPDKQPGTLTPQWWGWRRGIGEPHVQREDSRPGEGVLAPRQVWESAPKTANEQNPSETSQEVNFQSDDKAPVHHDRVLDEAAGVGRKHRWSARNPSREQE